jgi:hypothetical protein
VYILGGILKYASQDIQDFKKKQQIKGGGINNFACDVKLNKKPRPMILNTSWPTLLVSLAAAFRPPREREQEISIACRFLAEN